MNPEQSNLLRENERLDSLHRRGYQIIQDPGTFCFGMDAVLLSHFVRLKPEEAVLDLCTGSGIIPLLLAARWDNENIHGIEIQQEFADRAVRSVRMNGLESRVQIQQGDIRALRQVYTAASFHVVTANPPYMKKGSGRLNEQDSKTLARHEILCSFEDVCAAAAEMLRPNGRLYLVHRPQRLVDILYLLRQKRLEPKTMRLVQPHAHREPNMVLIESIRNGNPELKVLPNLIVYGEEGSYTQELYEIYYG